MTRSKQLFRSFLFGVLIAWSFGCCGLAAQEVPELNEKDLKEGLKMVAPPTDKPWRQIPWKISLLDAQNEAAKAKKPIFIWAMDGHPLGCT